ncbi:hypothetical protein [Nocardia acidivorans]|uniref:hypothetical protein n=1 Tax=Nocardia acidivorans TaxID=404580 RepID=UPI0012F9F4BC|nr:hypothetical protein [Nocardia acidivorans]
MLAGGEGADDVFGDAALAGDAPRDQTTERPAAEIRGQYLGAVPDDARAVRPVVPVSRCVDLRRPHFAY